MTNPVSRRAFLVGAGSLAFVPVAKHMRTPECWIEPFDFQDANGSYEVWGTGSPRVTIEQWNWNDAFMKSYLQSDKCWQPPAIVEDERTLRQRLLTSSAVARIDDGERFQETDEAEA